MLENAKNIAGKVAQHNKGKQTGKATTNSEAGGPMPGTNYLGMPGNSNTTIKYEDPTLRQYVRTLDQKFDQMIGLLSKLVSISTENANNVLSDAIAPARI